MGSLFGSSKPKGPSADRIRRQEERKIKKENLAALAGQEEKRAGLRGQLTTPEDEEISRKRLFGQ